MPFPFHRLMTPPRSTIFDIPPRIVMLYFGLSNFVVTIGWTW